jgi:hypothetical protein
VLLLVAGRDAALVRLDPDLQEVRRRAGCVVELAVSHAAARAHALHVAGPDDSLRRIAVGAAGAHAVLVRQRAFEHVADDFHVAVAVRPEAAAGGNAVLVDDAEVAEAHARRVVVVGEREAVAAFQPAVVGVAAVAGLAKGDHGALLCIDCHAANVGRGPGAEADRRSSVRSNKMNA